jgi:hypothetical protein
MKIQELFDKVYRAENKSSLSNLEQLLEQQLKAPAQTKQVQHSEFCCCDACIDRAIVERDKAPDDPNEYETAGATTGNWTISNAKGIHPSPKVARRHSGIGIDHYRKQRQN